MCAERLRVVAMGAHALPCHTRFDRPFSLFFLFPIVLISHRHLVCQKEIVCNVKRRIGRQSPFITDKRRNLHDVAFGALQSLGSAQTLFATLAVPVIKGRKKKKTRKATARRREPRAQKGRARRRAGPTARLRLKRKEGIWEKKKREWTGQRKGALWCPSTTLWRGHRKKKKETVARQGERTRDGVFLFL